MREEMVGYHLVEALMGDEYVSSKGDQVRFAI